MGSYIGKQDFLMSALLALFKRKHDAIIVLDATRPQSLESPFELMSIECLVKGIFHKHVERGENFLRKERSSFSEALEGALKALVPN